MTKNQKKIFSSLAIIITLIIITLFSGNIKALLQDFHKNNLNPKKEKITQNYDNDDWEGEEYPKFAKSNKIEGKKVQRSSMPQLRQAEHARCRKYPLVLLLRSRLCR